MDKQIIFTTRRLVIRPVEMADAERLHRLWRHPKVMRYVGFPKGLPISFKEICKKVSEQGSSEFGRLLLAEIKSTSEMIGECKMYLPEDDGIAHTDVKLFPEYWGNKYGVEIKAALVDYLFRNTDCRAISAGPNVENIASIKMQEAVGGERISEESYEFPPEKQDYTQNFRYYVYHVKRATWERMPSATE